MIKQLVPSSVCLPCRGCCRFKEADSVWTPHLLKQDINVLAKNNLLPSAPFVSQKLRLEKSKTQEANFICSFLIADDNKCKVYGMRPFECQLYPFLLNSKDKKVFLAVDLNCPFAREKLKNEELKEYTQYLIAFFNAQGGLKILKDNPQIIQEYPEALDLAELEF